ncbi:MAG: nucleotide exchange factor GrpE [candidate division SR1 bacterium]|nr:nucleotide exchange factor GrpE [candidate division SR1 bacterium]
MADKKNAKKQNINQDIEEKLIKNTTSAVETDKISELKLQQEIAHLKSQINSQSLEIDDWKNKALRISADLQNFQKQTEIDQLQTKKITKKTTIQNILPFLNTLNISFSYTPKTEDQVINVFIETLRSSFNKLVLDLKNNNIEIITANPGDIFNPAFMEILNSDFSQEEPKVKQVVSIGLKIDNQLIQPISVIVG